MTRWHRFWRWYWKHVVKCDAQPLLRRAYALDRLLAMNAIDRIVDSEGNVLFARAVSGQETP